MRGNAGLRGWRSRKSRGTDNPRIRTIIFHGDADNIVHPSNAANMVEAETGGEIVEGAEGRHATIRTHTRTVTRTAPTHPEKCCDFSLRSGRCSGGRRPKHRAPELATRAADVCSWRQSGKRGLDTPPPPARVGARKAVHPVNADWPSQWTCSCCSPMLAPKFSCAYLKTRESTLRRKRAKNYGSDASVGAKKETASSLMIAGNRTRRCPLMAHLADISNGRAHVRSWRESRHQ
jgi:hypothetical protein